MLMACSINMYNNCSTSIYQALDRYWGSIPGGLYTLAPAGRHLQSESGLDLSQFMKNTQYTFILFFFPTFDFSPDSQRIQKPSKA